MGKEKDKKGKPEDKLRLITLRLLLPKRCRYSDICQIRYGGDWELMVQVALHKLIAEEKQLMAAAGIRHIQAIPLRYRRKESNA